MNPKHCSACGASFLAAEHAKVHPHCVFCKVTNWQNARPVVLLLQPVLTPDTGLGLVVAKRGIMPDKGGFALPGGFMEKREVAVQSAVREFEEESGYALDWQTCRLLGDLPSANGEHMLMFVQNLRPLTMTDFGALQDTDEMSEWSVRTIEVGPNLCWSTHEAVVQRWLDLNAYKTEVEEEVSVFEPYFTARFIQD